MKALQGLGVFEYRKAVVCAGGGVGRGRKVLPQLAASPHLQIPSLDQALPCTPLPLSDPITAQSTVERNFLCLYVEWGGGWILGGRWVTDDLPIFSAPT